MAQIITPQHIYIYVVESKLGPTIVFFESKFGPSSLIFLLFCFFKNLLLSAGRMRFFRRKEGQLKQKLPFFESKPGPIMLHNILGPSFDSTLDQVLDSSFLTFVGHVCLLLQNMLKPLFLLCFQQNAFLKRKQTTETQNNTTSL